MSSSEKWATKKWPKKLMAGSLLLITAFIAAVLIFLPAYFERITNIVDGKPLDPVSAEAQKLHDSLTIVDLHADTLLWKRSMLDSVDRGHADLGRLQDGNVALQIFSSVTKTPRDQNYDSNGSDSDQITLLAMAQLQPIATWFSLRERSLHHADKLSEAVIKTEGALAKIETARSIEQMLNARSNGGNRMGVMLSIEGLQNLEGKRENLDVLYDAGFRMAGLTHFFDNELAGSMHGIDKGGLTDFGREIVTAMESKAMIVDIAHLSRAATKDVLAMATRPVVYSHGGVKAKCDVNRNLTDDEIRSIAANGGLIGIGYWDGAICDTSPKSIAGAIKYVRDLVGIEYVGLGSDFDGAVTTRFDTSGLVHVTQALMDAGLSNDEIRAVMGENAISFLKAGLEPK